jgi:Spy/CpxP family protein refolding chaperone
MKKFLILLPTVLLFLFAQDLVTAQPPEEKPRTRRGPERGAKIVETLRIWKMVDSLNLSEEQLVKFLPKLKKEKELRKEYGETKKKTLENLRELLRAEEVSEKEVKANLKELEKIGSEFQAKTKGLREEIKKILSLTQQAQFFIANEEFQKELHQLLGGMRRMRGQGEEHRRPQKGESRRREHRRSLREEPPRERFSGPEIGAE